MHRTVRPLAAAFLLVAALGLSACSGGVGPAYATTAPTSAATAGAQSTADACAVFSADVQGAMDALQASAGEALAGKPAALPGAVQTFLDAVGASASKVTDGQVGPALEDARVAGEEMLALVNRVGDVDLGTPEGIGKAAQLAASLPGAVSKLTTSADAIRKLCGTT